MSTQFYDSFATNQLLVEIKRYADEVYDGQNANLEYFTDDRSKTVEGCSFYNVIFSNLTFGGQTIFRNCSFVNCTFFNSCIGAGYYLQLHRKRRQNILHQRAPNWFNYRRTRAIQSSNCNACRCHYPNHVKQPQRSTHHTTRR